MSYYAQLASINNELKITGDAVKQMVDDGIGIEVINNFVLRENDRIQNKVNQIASQVSAQFVDRVRIYTNDDIKKNIANRLKISIDDVFYLPTNEETQILTVLREAFIAGNTQLIRSIPAKYFNDLSQAISNNFRGIAQVGEAKTLAGRIYEIGNISTRRANFIARDQTAKATANFAHERSKSAGADRYIWRTSEDQKVVGNPHGLYPKPTRGHGDHYARNGKVYYYSKPFADGLPGDAYGCRCYDEPILSVSNLLLAA